MGRVEVKFTPETPKQMEKRRFRRRVYRLLIIGLVINIIVAGLYIATLFGFDPKTLF